MRVKIFCRNTCKTSSEFEFDINAWLSQQPDIEIISTNVTHGGSYIILYKTKETQGVCDEVD